MLCPSCHSFRPANNGPCPQCNAPSPMLAGQSNTNFAQPAWGGPLTPSSSGEWNTSVSPGSSQEHDNTLWAQVMAPQMMQGEGNGQPAPGSALPVPYTGGQAPAPYMMGVDMGSATIQVGGAMTPAQAEGDGPIYIPPMYTKPRAIIPRYRIISGLISFIVVIGLVCGGGIYYARATGKLSFLSQIINPTRPNIAQTPTGLLPTPTTVEVTGPASNIVNSVATASTIDPNSGYPKNATNTFVVNQKIYLTYSIHTNTPGNISFKWYTNTFPYYSSPETAITQVKNGVNGNTVQIYAHPAQGMVEIYWNDQLAARLYFVVEPAPANAAG